MYLRYLRAWGHSSRGGHLPREHKHLSSDLRPQYCKRKNKNHMPHKFLLYTKY